jgi:predicted TIM-barrel enzyme
MSHRQYYLYPFIKHQAHDAQLELNTALMQNFPTVAVIQAGFSQNLRDGA